MSENIISKVKVGSETYDVGVSAENVEGLSEMTQAVENNCVKKTGDTMTGDLTVGGVITADKIVGAVYM